MRHSPHSALATILVLGMLPLSSTAAAAAGQTKCELTYNLKGWSAIYKTAHGEGVIRCDNGQSMPVAINVEGGGITFGKTEVKNATGKFSEVSKIDDLLGAYAATEAEAGAVKSAEAQALTKGEVSLALAGTGSGWSIGVSGAKFKITRRKK